MKKVMVAMSGGVDSSVCAYLLKNSGEYECIGVTMKLFSEKTEEDFIDARRVCESLGMEHRIVDLSKTFSEKVIDAFVNSYLSGVTPNPCIECNKHLKFGALLEIARSLNCDYIATGHYARIDYNEDTGKYILKKALDGNKDQSYFLYALTQEQLSHTLFPLGGMTKDKIREIALQSGLVTAKKADSQDVCFLPNGKYVEFIEKYIGKPLQKGVFKDTQGNILGESRGQAAYTIGQRKGLGISAPHPLYVCYKLAQDNVVILGAENELYSGSCIVKDISEMQWDLNTPRKVMAKIRYRKPEQPATAVLIDDKTLRIDFDEPQKSVCSGQAAVLYDGDCVIGGGVLV